MAFAPDGRRLATGGADGRIVLWEVGKRVLRELPRNGYGIMICLAFSPDGTILAAGDSNFEVVLWDATTGTERATLTGHADVVSDLDFSPDGATLATASLDRSIRIWNVASGRIQATLRGHSSGVRSIRFSPDGRTLASGSNAGRVKLWDVPTRKCRGSLGSDSTGNSVESLVYSRDGSTLACGSVNEPLRFWDVATGVEQGARRAEGHGIRRVAFSSCEHTVIAMTYDGNVTVSDLALRREQTIPLGKFQTICSTISPDGLLLALGDLDGTVRVWDLNRFVKAQIPLAASSYAPKGKSQISPGQHPGEEFRSHSRSSPVRAQQPRFSP